MTRQGRSPRECSGTAVRPYLGLGTIWPAGPWLEGVMPREVEKGAVVDDKTIRVFPDRRGLHAIVENLARYAPRPDQARIAEHHGEQPDDPRHPGLVGELNLEPGQIDLGLLARRSLEPHLERGDGVGPDVAHRALHRGIAASVAALSHFAPQPHRGEARKGDKPFAQIRQEWIGALLPVRPRTIGRRLQTARGIFANGLTVDAELTGNGSNLQA